jgi:hypothetical protein
MNTREENKQIAAVILEQLGGRRFITMTGASSFSSGESQLTFRIPKAKNGIGAVKITLTPMDVYKMEFVAWRGTFEGGDRRVEVVVTLDDIYFDSLQDAFTRETGLATHL